MQEDNKNIQQAESQQNKAESQPKQADAQQETGQQQSYAVPPTRHHHRRLEYSDKSNMLQVRNYLNIGFMLLALVGVILWTQMDDRTIAIVFLLIGVALKIAEVCIRLFKK